VAEYFTLRNETEPEEKSAWTYEPSEKAWRLANRFYPGRKNRKARCCLTSAERKAYKRAHSESGRKKISK
jgi:hypothetical protein